MEGSWKRIPEGRFNWPMFGMSVPVNPHFLIHQAIFISMLLQVIPLYFRLLDFITAWQSSAIPGLKLHFSGNLKWFPVYTKLKKPVYMLLVLTNSSNSDLSVWTCQKMKRKHCVKTSNNS